MPPVIALSAPCPAAPGIARPISAEERRRRLTNVARVLETIRQRLADEERERAASAAGEEVPK